MQKYRVDKDYHNSRFDRWFKANVIILPQSLIEKIIRKNKVKVNRKKTKTSYRVQQGDIVEVFDISKFKISERPKTIDYSIPRTNRIQLRELVVRSIRITRTV